RENMNRLDGPELERPCRRDEAAHLLRNLLEQLRGDLAHVRKPLRPRHGRHLRLMLEALLRRLERRGHVEDRASVLDRDDAPVAEAPAVAVALHVIDDRRVHVARPQEICVQRMNVPAFDGPARGAERLPEHLAAEYPAAADVAALAAEEIEL